jgi:serine/threonine protein phosphatase 1
MRVLAIGDIHGCSQALIALADAVKFKSDDVIVTLGDYVNRGPNSAAVLHWLVARAKTNQLIALRGNHEIMMLRAKANALELREWFRNGGDATLASYAPFDDAGRFADVPDEHWDFIENQCRDWYETETHFFVHANAYPDMPLNEQPDFMLFWEKFDDPPPHQSGKIMVCGHTSQKSGLPKNLGHAVCIDTWACGKGWLTCLDTASGRYWQANQSGEQRSNYL